MLQFPKKNNLYRSQLKASGARRLAARLRSDCDRRIHLHTGKGKERMKTTRRSVPHSIERVFMCACVYVCDSATGRCGIPTVYHTRRTDRY